MNQNAAQLGVKETKKNEKNPGVKSSGFIFFVLFCFLSQ